MQDNGLPAKDYVPLIDVEADAGLRLLVDLRAAQVAARLTPVAGDVVRVFVDRERLAQARVVAGTVPDLGAGDLDADPGPDPAVRADGRIDVSQEQVDAAWSALVADLGELRPADPPDQPQEPNDPARSEGSGLSQRLIRRHPPTPSGSTADDDAGADDDDDDLLPDEHFVPPTPPPLPRPRDAVDRFAWAGAIGGPILLVASHVLGLGTWVGGVGIAAFAAGFITLIARMRDERDDDGPGAVV